MHHNKEENVLLTVITYDKICTCYHHCHCHHHQQQQQDVISYTWLVSPCWVFVQLSFGRHKFICKLKLITH